MEPRTATVSQINGYIKTILDKNVILNNVWVKGELSNFKPHYSGHIYTTLKDEGGVLKAVMFKSAASKLSFMPSDGMKVLARGRVGVYEPSGAYQLYIEEMIPDGVGELYVAYEQLKAKLGEEGLFDEGHKKPIPKFPQRIGVSTATTGAAVRDIINVITRRYPLAEIIIYPTQVQGSGASKSIVEAIEYFNNNEIVDTLIVGRGGGSIEDLWAYNEEIVARAIFASKIPIISAVGHETDFTIADFVADLRAPTPSAAAEIAVPSTLELGAAVENYRTRALNATLKRIENNKVRISSMRIKSPTEIIEENYQRIDNFVKHMENKLMLKLSEGRRVLGESASKLDVLSPLQTLSRGYSIALTPKGDVVRTKDDLVSGDEFTLKLRDGDVECYAK